MGLDQYIPGRGGVDHRELLDPSVRPGVDAREKWSFSWEEHSRNMGKHMRNLGRNPLQMDFFLKSSNELSGLSLRCLILRGHVEVLMSTIVFFVDGGTGRGPIQSKLIWK